jgi:UDP-2-acetamido-3-amino-2,3-dideoxy-glucuronate N-acetyltransferase
MVFTNVVNQRSEVVRKDRYKLTLVKRLASVGAHTTVVCGITIGNTRSSGRAPVVTRDVPDFALVMGNPARRSGWMCRCGIKLRTNGRSLTCETCGTRHDLHGDVRMT